jgi:hypothetical protein
MYFRDVIHFIKSGALEELIAASGSLDLYVRATKPSSAITSDAPFGCHSRKKQVKLFIVFWSLRIFDSKVKLFRLALWAVTM